MPAFFDTSAIVPLILKEPHSGAAGSVWKQTSRRIAWQWLRVEVEAALVRRIAPPEAWTRWYVIESAMDWVEPEAGWLEHLRAFNRGAGLRSADAGHLYLMERCLRGAPGLRLVTFDHEMRRAAARRGIALEPSDKEGRLRD
jgi:predicted nucleic acid-binding protein